MTPKSIRIPLNNTSVDPEMTFNTTLPPISNAEYGASISASITFVIIVAGVGIFCRVKRGTERTPMALRCRRYNDPVYGTVCIGHSANQAVLLKEGLPGFMRSKDPDNHSMKLKKGTENFNDWADYSSSFRSYTPSMLVVGPSSVATGAGLASSKEPRSNCEFSEDDSRRSSFLRRMAAEDRSVMTLETLVPMTTFSATTLSDVIREESSNPAIPISRSPTISKSFSVQSIRLEYINHEENEKLSTEAVDKVAPLEVTTHENAQNSPETERSESGVPEGARDESPSLPLK